jgi:hypothetical protein
MFVVLAIFLLIFALVLAMGIGIGLLLHWLLPGIDLGVGILIGVVNTIGSIHLYMRANSAVELAEDDHLLEELISRADVEEIEVKPVRRWRKRRRNG